MAGFVFAERDVLVIARTRDLVTMVGEECFGESLETTFGCAGSLFGYALLVRVKHMISSILIYPFHDRSERALRGSRCEQRDRHIARTLVHTSYIQVVKDTHKTCSL